MGCTSSANIRLVLDRPNPVYLTDDIVSGRADILVTSECQADAVDIVVKGVLGYVTHSRSKNRRRTHYHHVLFYSLNINLLRPEPSQDELTLAVGSYSWPFQFKLPTTLPPSLNLPTSYPNVSYYAQLVIDKAWYKRNHRKNFYFMVYPRVEIQRNPIIPIQPPSFTEYNRKDVHLQGTLDKTLYVPGDKIVVKFEIDNPKMKTIQRITMSMHQFHRIGPAERSSTMFPTVISELINTKAQHISETRTFPIPDLLLPPTFEFMNPEIPRCNLQIYYYFKFNVEVEGFFTDFDVRLPLILGAHPKIDQGAANLPRFSFTGHDVKVLADEGSKISDAEMSINIF